jgi:Domain of unknown function (DUF1772)
MVESPLPLRIAQMVGLTATSAIAGASFAVSAYVVPRILESPSPLLLRQWKHLFESGKATIPPLSLITSIAIGYLAYEAKGNPNALPHQWKLYLISGILNLGIVPYTLVVMLPTNNKLLAKAEETSSLKADDKLVEVGLGGESAHQLVDRWATLNLGRTILLVAAASLAAWTTLE